VLSSSYDSFLKHLLICFEQIPNTHVDYAYKKKSWESFLKYGLPTLQNEKYKFTNVEFFGKCFDDKSVLFTPISISEKTIKDILYDLHAYHLIVVNGILLEQYSRLPTNHLDIKLTGVSTFKNDYFNRLNTVYQDPFLLLNDALYESTVNIEIINGKQIDLPIFIYNIVTSPFVNPRINISLGANSNVRIVNSFIDLSQNNKFCNSLIQIEIKLCAKLEYYTIQCQSNPNSSHINSTLCYQESKSEFINYIITNSNSFIRNNLYTSMIGAYAKADMYGLYNVYNSGYVDNYVYINHIAENTSSNQSYKGIINDKSVGVFNGNIYVQPTAQKTNAFQSNKNILLSDEATIHTKPNLEIRANDVKCSHGATVGQLDKEQLFYLCTKGLDENSAKQILLDSFVNEILQKIPIKLLGVISRTGF